MHSAWQHEQTMKAECSCIDYVVLRRGGHQKFPLGSTLEITAGTCTSHSQSLPLLHYKIHFEMQMLYVCLLSVFSTKMQVL